MSSGRPRLTVIFHAQSGLLEHVPAEVERISRFADVHVVFEVSPRAWLSNLLELPRVNWPPGVHDARGHLREALPEGVWRMVCSCAGLWYAVYPPLWHPLTLSVLRVVAQTVKSIDPAVVHLDGESFRCALWMRLLRVPYVVAVHEPRVPTGSHLPQLAIAERMLVPKADGLIVHSAACRDELRDRWGIAQQTLVLCPLGPMEVFRAWCGVDAGTSADNGLRVVLWGRLGPRKGIQTYFEAARIASAELHDVTFVLAGGCIRGYALPPLPKLMNGCRFEILEKWLANGELCNLVLGSDIVALPYTDAMQSGVALTAFAFGKPVIASDTGGIREQVDPGLTGELFPLGDAEAMARVLVGVLGNTHTLRRMKAEVVSRWGTGTRWDTFEEGVRRIYSEVVGR
jgi:starch synthase